MSENRPGEYKGGDLNMLDCLNFELVIIEEITHKNIAMHMTPWRSKVVEGRTIKINLVVSCPCCGDGSEWHGFRDEYGEGAERFERWRWCFLRGVGIPGRGIGVFRFGIRSAIDMEIECAVEKTL